VALGVGTSTFCRALAARAAEATEVTVKMIQEAEWIPGSHLTEQERVDFARAVTESLTSFAQLRKVNLDHEVLPALSFLPDLGPRAPSSGATQPPRPSGIRPNGPNPTRIWPSCPLRSCRR
jgi:hypothetical protein